MYMSRKQSLRGKAKLEYSVDQQGALGCQIRYLMSYIFNNSFSGLYCSQSQLFHSSSSSLFVCLFFYVF